MVLAAVSPGEGNAASHVHSTGRQNLQRKIAGLAGQYSDKQVNLRQAQFPLNAADGKLPPRSPPCAISLMESIEEFPAVLDFFLHRIGIRRYSRADTLHTHVSETKKKILQQADLTLIRRSNISTAPFGAVGYIL